eukprot:scaffold869_cov160-Ochromonas_danica.AAC.19
MGCALPRQRLCRRSCGKRLRWYDRKASVASLPAKTLTKKSLRRIFCHPPAPPLGRAARRTGWASRQGHFWPVPELLHCFHLEEAWLVLRRERKGQVEELCRSWQDILKIRWDRSSPSPRAAGTAWPSPLQSRGDF